MNPGSGEPLPRLVILGLDGATWDLLDPWIAAGQLPTLERLRREGSWGPLRSVYPPGTGPAWSSIATGVGPGKHGIYEFMRREAGSYRLSPVDSSALRRLALWDILGAAGAPSYLLNVPLTYPPRPIHGLMVTGILTPPGASDITYPPAFAREVETLAPGYQVLPRSVYRPGGAASFLAELRRTVAGKTALLLALAERREWRLLFQVWNEPDIAQHALWHLEDERHPHHDPREARGAPRALLSLYQDLDTALARLEKILPANTTVAVVSDHGAGPLHRLIHGNIWLMRCGLLAVRRSPWSRAKQLAFRWGFTPMGIYLRANRAGFGRVKSRLRWTGRGYDLMRRAFFSFADVDWRRTVAYGVGGGVSGGIFLNVRGREPSGIVGPGAAYERARDEVAAALRELKDPLTGEAVIGEVLRREDIYRGPYLESAPDLVMVPRDPAFGIFGDFEFSSNRLVEEAPPALSGHHRMEGVFALRGPRVQAGGRLAGARLEDVAPTLLHLAGFPPSEDMDGRVLEEALRASERREHPPARVARAPERAEDGSVRPYTAEEEEEIRRRLREMGYIS